MRGANEKTEVGEVPRGLHINAGKEGARLLAAGITVRVSVAAFRVHIVIFLGSRFFRLAVVCGVADGTCGRCVVLWKKAALTAP